MSEARKLLIEGISDAVGFIGGALAGYWIGQFIGHRLEGRKPSFFEDIQYLWVGPLFVLTRLGARLRPGTDT